MSWFSSKSIRTKLILIILFVSIITVAIVGAARIAWDVKQARQGLVDKLSAVTGLIGDRSSAALIFDDPRLAQENLSSLKVIRHVVQACMYLPDGTILAKYQRDKNSLSCPPVLHVKNMKEHKFESNRLHLAFNIQQGTQSLGWIHLDSDLSLIDDTLQNQVVFTTLALLAAIFITILLANWVQRLISGPIKSITKVAREIEEHGDHSIRATEKSSDEIGQLAHTFNAMLDSLEEQNLQLQRSQKMDALGKLTGGIAHDYNNSLNVVLGFVQLLELEYDNKDLPDTNDYIKEIRHAAEHGAKLTKKLLAFSRNKSSAATRVDINELLQAEKNMLDKTLTARIALKYDLGENLWPVWLDDSDIEDAILNMSINASHAIEGNGTISIQTRNIKIIEAEVQQLGLEQGDYVLLSITDSGFGMDSSTREKIFDPFFSTKGEKGTGLGLSQVYGFVKRSGGTVNVYSELGHGTRFSIYFPRYEDNADSKDTEEANIKVNLDGTETILLVDDELAILKFTSQLLSKHGYTVFCAESGKQALDILAVEHVDLLIADIIMPEMEGYELASVVQQNYPGVKIQLASGFYDDRHAGMIDPYIQENIIQKPYNLDFLLNRIRKLFD